MRCYIWTRYEHLYFTIYLSFCSISVTVLHYYKKKNVLGIDKSHVEDQENIGVHWRKMEAFLMKVWKI